MSGGRGVGVGCARGVPWRGAVEWRSVCSELGAERGAREALRTLSAWKARCSALASGPESTLALLELQGAGEAGDRVLRLAYSAALMRFVNHMLDGSQVRGLGLYTAARAAGLPDWLVDVRHDAAHGDSLPSLQLLRHAAGLALAWLQTHYWDSQRDLVNDYVVGSHSLSELDERKLSRLITFYASLVICVRPEYKIDRLAHIPDIEMKESIIQEASELFQGYDLTDPAVVSISSLLISVEKESKDLLRTKDAAEVINRTILGPNALFLSMEMLKLFDEESFINHNVLSQKYMLSWERLLTFLHSNDLILSFILELDEITKSSARDECVRKLAALWIKEILRALKKSKLYIEKFKKSHFQNGVSNTTKNHRIQFKLMFPNEQNGLTLNLLKQVPGELRSSTFVRQIISSYNPYLIYFVKDLLNLLDSPLSKESVDNLLKLTKLISGRIPEQSGNQKDRIFTVEDVNMKCGNGLDRSNDGSVESDCIEVSMQVEEEVEEFEDPVWKLAQCELDWSKCPIGVLPWQIKMACDV